MGVPQRVADLAILATGDRRLGTLTWSTGCLAVAGLDGTFSLVTTATGYGYQAGPAGTLELVEVATGMRVPLSWARYVNWPSWRY